MGQTIVQVDAFTDRPFAGNPAAVCVLPAARDEAWMQAVAREMNLSETAFLQRRGGDWELRWFTPTVEVDLCGHATLASAHVLWEDGWLAAGAEARFHTRSGLLTARRDGEWIAMDFPAMPEEETAPSPELVRALGATPAYVGQGRFDCLVELASEEEVRELRPDLGLLRQVPARGIIVTSRSEMPGIDFVSRFFAPRVGVDEDPVTGSAHCCLAPFWARRLGRSELVGFQASERGGTVRARTDGDRVHLGGQAVTVLRGELV
ncbi:MAG TPA: PhzF family phenazine biosynthesis protein [Longimicrobiaceae bacterium]|nr:PhzF family phenazine biosynthesis protein [Longimicrobiaceae bacterium]